MHANTNLQAKPWFSSSPKTTLAAPHTGRQHGRSFSPDEEVDENDDREEEASAAGVSAQEQHQVTDGTERQHPQHVPLEEEEEAVAPGQHRRQVLQPRCSS